MELNFIPQQGATVVQMVGELDSSNVPAVQEKILTSAVGATHVVLDMSQVAYMSSAGLRMLLTVYRSISGQGGKVVLVGLSADLIDTMSMTGFLDFFSYFDKLEDGLAALAGA